MPITLLPDSTVRAIGSSLALNDASSVVKELLDNALDARATVVTIEIASNTLDVIQVKDDGIGISPQDRQFVCQPNSTSKLETITELKTIGGKSLGFRGQALASVAELSSHVTVTTRISGDVVASRLQYNRAGRLVSSENASHPLGSTIKIQEFLKHVPVRRQTAIKSSTKTLTTIKRILHAYAFARPSVRLSLKVLKAKTDRYNWNYGPKRDASLRDLCMQVAGLELASQCCSETATGGQQENSQASDSEDLDTENSKLFSITAFLPHGNADLSKVGNHGQFVSVDGRPIGSEGGFGKDVQCLYKSYLRSFAASHGARNAPRDPFLCLQLRCPPESYDINVEPAKDDLIFEDNRIPLAIIADLFKRVYGPLQDTQETPDTPAKLSSTGRPEHVSRLATSFDILLAKPRATIPGCIILAGDNSPNGSTAKDIGVRNGVAQDLTPAHSPPPVPPKQFTSMSGFDEDEISLEQEPPSDPDLSDSDELEIKRPNVNNPWTISKLNASVPRGRKSSIKSSSRPVAEVQSPRLERRSSSPIPAHNSSKQILDSSQVFPSPIESPSPQFFQNPGPPKRPWKALQPVGGDENGVIAGSPMQNQIDTWIKHPQASASITRGARSGPPAMGPSPNSGLSRGQRELSIEAIDYVDVLSENVHLSTGINKPFNPHLKTHSKPIHAANELRGFPQRISQPTASTPSSGRTLNTIPQMLDSTSELDEVMDFEYRKKAAQLAQKHALTQKLTQRTLSLKPSPSYANEDEGPLLLHSSQNLNDGSISSPHRNRYLAAKAALGSSSLKNPESSPQRFRGTSYPYVSAFSHSSSLEPQSEDLLDEIKTSMHPSDPRCRLLTRLKSNLSRTKSCLLPLECSPPHLALHNFHCRLSVPTVIEDITSNTTASSSTDTFPSSWHSLLRAYTSSHPTKYDNYVRTSGISSSASTADKVSITNVIPSDTSDTEEENISSTWSDGDISASAQEIEKWEARIRELLVSNPMTRENDPSTTKSKAEGREGSKSSTSITQQEPIPAIPQIDLRTTLQNFVQFLSSSIPQN